MKHIIIPTAIFPPKYAPRPNPYMSTDESLLLLTILLTYDRPSVLELGTHRGVTSNNMARLLAPMGGHLRTIDVKRAPDSLPEAQSDECLPVAEIGSAIEERYRKDCTVAEHLLDGADVGKELDDCLSAADCRHFDVAVLDGDHSIKGVARDLGVVSQYLATDGMILYHDVWWDEPDPIVSGPLEALADRMVPPGVVLNASHWGVSARDGRVIQERAMNNGGR